METNLQTIYCYYYDDLLELCLQSSFYLFKFWSVSDLARNPRSYICAILVSVMPRVARKRALAGFSAACSLNISSDSSFKQKSNTIALFRSYNKILSVFCQFRYHVFI